MEIKRGRPPGLSIEEIIEAVLQDGIMTFTMPSLGDRLGVAHSGLYRYVESREALVVLALDHIAKNATWPTADLPWIDQLAALGETLWATCQQYPGYALAALSTQHVSPGFVTGLTPTVKTLNRQGFDIVAATASTEHVATLVLNSSILADRMSRLTDAGNVPEHTVPGFADPELWAGRAWYRRHFDVYMTGLQARLPSGHND